MIGTVKLIRPVVRASFDGQKFHLGTLQKLVEEALAKPPQEPGPSVSVEDGLLDRAGHNRPAGDLGS